MYKLSQFMHITPSKLVLPNSRAKLKKYANLCKLVSNLANLVIYAYNSFEINSTKIEWKMKICVQILMLILDLVQPAHRPSATHTPRGFAARPLSCLPDYP